jgi:hypothetical protein
MARSPGVGRHFKENQPMTIAHPKFRLGRTVITTAAKATLNAHDVTYAVRRHECGDWGDCGDEDWNENELSLQQGARLLSVYRDRNGHAFWIITEADRSSTTVLLPEDY